MIATRVCEPPELQYAELSDPRPGPDEVLIDNLAIGCNFPDILIVQGKYQVKPPLPFSPGCEVAGVVREVGSKVTRVAPGQRVLALTGWGGYATVIAVPEQRVFPIPDGMIFEEAAGFGLVFQTSYCALVHRAALRSGETLLVHAAAGGVGLSAVQIGKALGARVIATSGSAEKLEIARQSGADVLINYRDDDWVERVKQVTDGRGADVIYDPVGGDVFDGSGRCIAWEGRLLVIGFAGGRIPSMAANRVLLKNFSVVGVHWGRYLDDGSPLVDQWMDALFALYARGQVRPVIYRSFPLPDAADALAAITSRESYGKVILLP